HAPANKGVAGVNLAVFAPYGYGLRNRLLPRKFDIDRIAMREIVIPVDFIKGDGRDRIIQNDIMAAKEIARVDGSCLQRDDSVGAEQRHAIPNHRAKKQRLADKEREDGEGEAVHGAAPSACFTSR